LPAPIAGPVGGARAQLQQALGADYQLGPLLGTGGFAEVYAAWDLRLKREVAVKTLRADVVASADMLWRFQREAEGIARLRHPHIVPVYVVGQKDGTAFFVMPKIEGASLADAMRSQSRWSLPDVCRILREAAGALGEAHRAGLIHRDVKPENLMLEGPGRRVVVMDFGIAKSIGETGAGLTATGLIMGTPHYMSPEQGTGIEKVSPLSDQYSLGVVGFRLLTGRLPFEGDTPQAIIYQHAAAPTPSIEALRPDAPAGLIRALSRALSKSPDDRWPSMEAFSEEIARVAQEVAGEFRSGRSQESYRARTDRARVTTNRILRSSLALTVLGTAAFAVLYPRAESYGPRRVLGQRDEAVASAIRTLRADGVPPGSQRSTRAYFFGPFAFLQEAVGHDSAVALLSGPAGGWGWEAREYDRARRTSVSAQAGPSGDVQSFFVSFAPDSILVSETSADSARIIAVAYLARHGVAATELSDERMSVFPGRRVTRRAFSWDLSRQRVVLGDDTSSVRAAVSVLGNRVVSSSIGFTSPPKFVSGLRAGTRDTLSSLGRVLGLCVFLVALVVATRRAARDTLQWTPAIRLAAVVALTLLVTYNIPVALTAASTVGFGVSGNSLNQIVDSLNVTLIATVVLSLMTLATFLAGESLTYERRPDILVGVGDAARGRLTMPELVPACLAGYAAAGVALAAIAAGLAAAHSWLGVPFDGGLFYSTGLYGPLPSFSVPSSIGSALPVGAVLLLLVSLSLGLRWPMWLTSIAWTIYFALARLDAAPTSEGRIVVEALVFSALPWFLLRHGALATIIALYVVFASQITADLIWAGGPYLVSAIAGIGFTLLPAIIAALAHLRRRTEQQQTPA
jgi:tRNA A-37 threonylcarbamoyl transferase component Bud32